MRKGVLMVDDGIVDEVAVSRALEGDPTVWPRLRPGERRELFRRVVARREAELAEIARDLDVRKAVLGRTGGGRCNDDEWHKRQDWLVKAAQAGGYGSPGTLLDTAKKHLRAVGEL